MSNNSSNNNFAEAFDEITRSRHYEPPPQFVPASSLPRSPSTPAPSSSHSFVAKNPKAILANPRQRANPILKHVRTVPIEFATDSSMPADYGVSNSTVLLYLSIKYHKLNPDYLIARMDPVKRQYKLRVVLVQVDDVDCESALLRIQALCVANGFTTICAFSDEEAARYLETYKLYEKKSSEEIEERKNLDYVSRATDALTQVRSVNKSDVKNLLRNFRSVGAVLGASMEDFALCAGIGEKKVARMYDSFNEPFFVQSQKASQADRDVQVDTVVLDDAVAELIDEADEE